jgi:probable F420-dependent oxidoreductase
MRFWQAVFQMEPGQLLDVARASEEAGIHGITLSDHVLHPQRLQSAYPYSDTGAPGFTPDTPWIDPFVAIPAMAAVTTRLEFTTNVLIGPLRNPFLLAKTVASAAVLSGDRVALGLGVGWMAEEFAAAGQDFHTRGRRTDEMIELLRVLWRGGMQEHRGRFYDTGGPVQMSPAPGRPVPIWIGGHSEPALRRAARLGDGWIAASAYPPDEAWHHLDRLKAALAEAGRDPSAEGFEIVMAVLALPEADLYRRFRDAGVTGMLCAPWMFAASPSVDDRRRAILEFGQQVVAKV